MQNNVFCIVPARGGSKRLPGKNSMDLCGRSLLGRTADFLKGEEALAQTILSTDDEAIAQHGRDVGLHVPFLRPQSLAHDESSSLEAVLHALDWLEQTGDSKPDFVALVQPTSPFRRPGLLRDALDILSAMPQINSVIAMQRLPHTSRHTFKQNIDPNDGSKPLGGGDPLFVPCGSLYVVRSRALLAQASFYASPLQALEVSEIEAVDVDTPADMKLAGAILEAGLWPEDQSD